MKPLKTMTELELYKYATIGANYILDRTFKVEVQLHAEELDQRIKELEAERIGKQ